ncbi:hypothetical protein CBS147346_1186 [Aspergillus niger]|nr:hypothetical protein CBS147346_1186 [Aspergillus niger]
MTSPFTFSPPHPIAPGLTRPNRIGRSGYRSLTPAARALATAGLTEEEDDDDDGDDNAICISGRCRADGPPSTLFISHQQLTSLTPEQDRDFVVVVAALRSGGVTLSAKRDVLEFFSRHQARISLASSPAPTAPPFNSSADASVAFVYFHSAFWPRSTNLILTGPTVLSVSISSDILTAFAILILALLTLPAAVAAAAPSAPTSTLFAIAIGVVKDEPATTPLANSVHLAH